MLRVGCYTYSELKVAISMLTSLLSGARSGMELPFGNFFFSSLLFLVYFFYNFKHRN